MQQCCLSLSDVKKHWDIFFKFLWPSRNMLTLSIYSVHKKRWKLQSKHLQCIVVRNCAWFLSRHLNWTHQQQLFFLVSNFTFCFQSARLEPYKIEQEWNHMVLLPRPTLCTRTYTSRLLCMFFSSVNAFWTNLEIPALLSRGTVTEFLSIKSRVCIVSCLMVHSFEGIIFGVYYK